MKFEIRRYEIAIIPENPQDTAYIEEVLGLRRDGDAALTIRQNAHGLGCMGAIYVKPAPAPTTEDRHE